MIKQRKSNWIEHLKERIEGMRFFIIKEEEI